MRSYFFSAFIARRRIFVESPQIDLLCQNLRFLIRSSNVPNTWYDCRLQALEFEGDCGRRNFEKGQPQIELKTNIYIN